MALQMYRRKEQSAPDPFRELAGITHHLVLMSGQQTERVTSSAPSLQHASELKDLSVTGASVTGPLSFSVYLDPPFKRCF